MKTPKMSTEKHACWMPNPKRSKYQHRIYVCDCLCGWTSTLVWRSGNRANWGWEQVL